MMPGQAYSRSHRQHHAWLSGGTRQGRHVSTDLLYEDAVVEQTAPLPLGCFADYRIQMSPQLMHQCLYRKERPLFIYDFDAFATFDSRYESIHFCS